VTRRYLLIAVVLVGLYACDNQPRNTSRIIDTLGHETLHCFFGAWHDPMGKHPSRIDVTNQLVESMTVVVKFAKEAELQRLYREAAGLHTALDRQIDKVNGFNVRDPNTNVCTVYILET
jgi:hypothetical protein